MRCRYCFLVYQSTSLNSLQLYLDVAKKCHKIKTHKKSVITISFDIKLPFFMKAKISSGISTVHFYSPYSIKISNDGTPRYKYIVDRNSSYFVINNSKLSSKYKKEDIFKMMKFCIDNIFV